MKKAVFVFRVTWKYLATVAISIAVAWILMDLNWAEVGDLEAGLTTTLSATQWYALAVQILGPLFLIACIDFYAVARKELWLVFSYMSKTARADLLKEIMEAHIAALKELSSLGVQVGMLEREQKARAARRVWYAFRRFRRLVVKKWGISVDEAIMQHTEDLA